MKAKEVLNILRITRQTLTKFDKEEVFEEIVSLLHCYSKKLYSKRNKDKNTLEIQLDE